MGILTLLLALALSACGRGGAEVDDRALQAADDDPANWVTYGRTYSEQRHSPLNEINEQTVSRLGLAWSLDLGTTRGLEATPLVKDGVLYTTSAWSVVHAVDAKTGRQLWMHDPKVPKDHAKFVCCDVVNRGAALYQGKVYAGTLDGRLIALDAKTGSLVWEAQTTPAGTAYSITGAPRIAKGRVLIGNGGAEYGVRGYVSAYDAETGQMAWRTYTVPGDPSKPFESEAMKQAAATWTGEWWKAGGGGTAWDSIVYDPDLDLVFVGTGNGSPWYARLRSPGGGDNLYLASILALRADTGEQVWHFQTTPGDNWDYTATQPLMLADLTINGQQRRVIMQAPKNGFFYVLDRETGGCISAKQFTEITWATGVDSSCRPIESSEAREMKGATFVSPAPQGAHNWHPMSYNPATGLVYFSVTDATALHVVDNNWGYNPYDQNIGRNPRHPGLYDGPEFDRLSSFPVQGRLVAWDPVAQREAWRAEHPLPMSGGTLSTAGNLVFQGRADGRFRAYRATDGKLLWESDAGTGIAASPITYTVDGQQYVAVLAGWGGPEGLGNRALGKGRFGTGRLVAFTLDGSGTLTLSERVVLPVPLPTFEVHASRADIFEGRALFRQYCSRCHGGDAVSSGSVPDLRYASTAIHETFEGVVRGGVRRQFGMPSFAEDITSAQVRLIQSYILDRARESARAAAPSEPRP
ncbi:MAG: PQQ-dependent dehydrogenase, methanol/ethanol family [Terriglobia bacterium]